MEARIGYGDSCETGDDKYVLAQFRADAILDWVIDLRSVLNVPELKYKHYASQKHRVASNAELQRQITRGLKQAEITIIDRPKYQNFAIYEFLAAGAEPGYDFGREDILNLAADNMIRDTPLNSFGRYSDYDWLSENITLPRVAMNTMIRTPFTIDNIRRRSGGKLRDAVVVAAQAHSMLTPTEKHQLKYLSLHPHSRGLFARSSLRIASMTRVFDAEHSKSLPILNEFVDRVAHMTGHISQASQTPLAVSEAQSTESDHIQAADFAAGWAADLLVATDSDYRALASKVLWAGVNGIVIPG